MTTEPRATEPPCALLFKTEDLVPGNGFLARVEISGRILAVLEDGEWWFYGVQPGALAEGAANPPEAFVRFRASIHNVLEDAATESVGYEAFESEVRRFFDQIDEGEAQRWDVAVEAFRSGKAVPPPPFDVLPKRPFATRCEVRVTKLSAPGTFADVEAQPELLSLPAAA